MMKTYALGELFSGAGGLALGAVRAAPEKTTARIRHAWATDLDADACATYRQNICHGNDGSVLCGDVRQIDLRPENPFFRSHPFNAFAFGFPCNDFSTIGKQKGFSGTYGPLYTYGVRVLRAFRPEWFLAENVSGLRSANGREALPKILMDFSRAGYRVYPHLYAFEQYGVPQARHRIIIVGIRDDLPQIFRPPAPTTPDPSSWRTAREALEDPPIPQDVANHEMPHMSPVVQERLRFIRPGENAFTANLPPKLRLHVRGARISQIYRRLDPDRPAYTVTGSGGGGTHIYHYKEDRSLTNRERARLQTFPDSYVFLGTRESVRRQIGMAVPCEGARQIFTAILNTMEGIPYWSVPCNIQSPECIS